MLEKGKRHNFFLNFRNFLSNNTLYQKADQRDIFHAIISEFFDIHL